MYSKWSEQGRFVYLLLVGGLEHEGDGVRLVLSLHRDDVIIGSASQNLG